MPSFIYYSYLRIFRPHSRFAWFILPRGFGESYYTRPVFICGVNKVFIIFIVFIINDICLDLFDKEELVSWSAHIVCNYQGLSILNPNLYHACYAKFWTIIMGFKQLFLAFLFQWWVFGGFECSSQKMFSLMTI